MKKKLIAYLKIILKLITHIVSFILALFFVSLSFFINYKSCSIAISMFPFLIGDYIRWWYYKLTLPKVGRNFKIGWCSYIVYADVEIGDNVTIEEKCVISKCKIGNNVILAANVSTMSGKNHHSMNDVSKTFYESEGVLKTIILGDNLWIGTHSVIMDDVSDGTVVGAGAVVICQFPPNSIIGGVPAKFIRLRG